MVIRVVAPIQRVEILSGASCRWKTNSQMRSRDHIDIKDVWMP